MTNTTKLTAETITDDQIRALQNEAADAGDSKQVRLCEIALYGTPESPSTILSLIADGNLSEAQIEARAKCADAINNGQG